MTKTLMLVFSAVLGAIAVSELPAFVGEWSDLVQRVSAAVAGVLAGGATIRRPGDRPPVGRRPPIAPVLLLLLVGGCGASLPRPCAAIAAGARAIGETVQLCESDDCLARHQQALDLLWSASSSCEVRQ